MRLIVALGVLLAPAMAMAAAGGVGEGFGADDWLAKWPVLVIVVGLVATGTTLFSIRIFRRGKEEGVATEAPQS